MPVEFRVYGPGTLLVDSAQYSAWPVFENHHNIVPPSISRIAREGETLQAGFGTRNGYVDAGFLLWLRRDPSGGSCVQVSLVGTGAALGLCDNHDSYYTVQAADVGSTLRVRGRCTTPTPAATGRSRHPPRS